MDKPIKLLIFGRNKSGKSTLVESILGRGQNTNEYPNDDSGADVNQYVPLPTRVSINVHLHEGRTRDNRKLQVFDVPALDNIYPEEKYILTEVVKKTEGEAHLLLFCIDMRRRLNQQDRICLGHIDRAYGRSVWKNTMIILTFGNEAGNEEDFLQQQTAIRNSFADCPLPGTGVIPCLSSSDILSKVPVIPVGRRSSSLPDHSDWEKNFWDSADKIIKIGPTTLRKMCNKYLWLAIITLCATVVIVLVITIVTPTAVALTDGGPLNSTDIELNITNTSDYI